MVIGFPTAPTASTASILFKRRGSTEQARRRRQSQGQQCVVLRIEREIAVEAVEGVKVLKASIT
jgi:hypothetical protein